MIRGWVSSSVTRRKMFDLDVSPPLTEVFCHQSSVAVVGPVLAAEQAGTVEERWIKRILDSPTSHQRHEAFFILLPAPPLLLVSVQDLLCWRQARHVHVVHITDLAQKVGEVMPLGESSQLRHIVEAHIHYPFRPGITQRLEEFLRPASS